MSETGAAAEVVTSESNVDVSGVGNNDGAATDNSIADKERETADGMETVSDNDTAGKLSQSSDPLLTSNSPISPSSRLKLNDTFQPEEEEEVQSSGCCGRKKKRRKPKGSQTSGASITDGNPTSPKGKKGKKKEDKKMRRKTISVEAFTDMEKVVELDEDEMAEVKSVFDKIEGAFQISELNSLYADYKLNGKEITQTDFHVVFSTLTRSGDASLADIVFAMFDSDSSGKLTFLKFIEALAIMTRGTPDQKMELCFEMIDTNKDGELDHSELVGLLKYLPMKRMKKQSDALYRMSTVGEVEKLDEVKEEDEDAEDLDDSARPRFGSTRQAGEASTIVRIRARDKENEKLAVMVVDEAYKALDKPVTETLVLDEFKLLSGLPEIAEYFMPFLN